MFLTFELRIRVFMLNELKQVWEHIDAVCES